MQTAQIINNEHHNNIHYSMLHPLKTTKSVYNKLPQYHSQARLRDYVKEGWKALEGGLAHTAHSLPWRLSLPPHCINYLLTDVLLHTHTHTKLAAFHQPCQNCGGDFKHAKLRRTGASSDREEGNSGL